MCQYILGVMLPRLRANYERDQNQCQQQTIKVSIQFQLMLQPSEKITNVNNKQQKCQYKFQLMLQASEQITKGIKINVNKQQK